MYEYIQNDFIEYTVQILFQSLYVGRLFLTDVWSFAEMIYFGDEAEEEEEKQEEMGGWRRNDPGEVGNIGWENEYEDCLTALYRYLLDNDSVKLNPNNSPSPATSPSLPLAPVPYPEKYNAEWKKRIACPLKEQPSLQLSTLKHNVLFETTPFGNVIMYYDAEKDSFIYYSDKTLSYPIINAVGKKYVLTFRCETLYNDVDSPSLPAAVAEDPSSPVLAPAPAPAPATPVPESHAPSVAEKSKSHVFAKFKNYRDPTTTTKTPIGVRPPYKNKNTLSTTATTSSATPQQETPKNRYTCEGKLANYSFLQKVSKVKPFSYKDFKLKQKPTTVAAASSFISV
jgi:hypothetical protein